MMAMILEVYQRQEEQRIDALKDALRKFIVYEASYIRNLQYDIESLAKVMEDVNPIEDVNLFITENTSPNPKAFKYIFEPYVGTHPSFKGGDSRMFSIKNPLIELSDDTKKLYKEETETITLKAWNGEANKDEINRFSYMARYSVGRETFCNKINSRKLPIYAAISENGFYQLGELMNIVLTESKNYSDNIAAKNIIYLSQSFRKETAAPVHQWQYLQSLIASHQIFAKMDFWDNIIQNAIDEDIKNYEIYGISEGETNDERIKNIAFCQLGAFGHMMLDFHVDTMYAAELVSKYACRYELSTEDMDTLMATVDKEFLKRDPMLEERKFEVQRGVPD